MANKMGGKVAGIKPPEVTGRTLNQRLVSGV
jgi:hypothetical protein